MFDTPALVGVCSHPIVDDTQSLLQRFLSGVSVVGVRLLIELCDILHHLRQTTTTVNTLPEDSDWKPECEWYPYLVLVGETPDPNSHFHGKDEEQEEEELKKATCYWNCR